jgi:hypothetical protein
MGGVEKTRPNRSRFPLAGNLAKPANRRKPLKTPTTCSGLATFTAQSVAEMRFLEVLQFNDGLIQRT